MNNNLTENLLFCRTCLTEAQDLLIQLDVNVINILKACTSVHVDDNEPFKLICHECHATLLNFNEFRLRCVNVDAFVKARVPVKHEKRAYQNGQFNAHVKVEEGAEKSENVERKEYTETCKRTSDGWDDDDEATDNWPLSEVVKQQNERVKDVKSCNEDSDDGKSKTLSKLPASKFFVCIYCTKVFTDKSRYKSHGASEHPEVEKSTAVLKTCEFCHAQIKGTKALLKHMRVEHKSIVPTIPCDDCGGVFLVEEQKTNHILNEHSPQTCQVCSKNLIKGRTGLVNHLKGHARQYLMNTFAKNDTNLERIDEKILVNVECSLTEKKREIFEKIGASRTSSRTIQCSKCPKMFANRRQVQRHEFVHVKEKPFMCKECPKSFCQLNLLTTHVKQMHASKPIYKCEQCHEAFYVELALTRHMERVHFDPTCKYCHQPFTAYKKLRKHINRVHADTVALYCEPCDRIFKQERSYKLHMDRHNGADFRQICTVCGLKFLHLSMHMFNVHKIGQRTFKCRRCAETFDSKKAVRTHANLFHHVEHAKEDYAYQCVLCPKRFLLKINLDNHYTRKHGPERVVRHKCTLCNIEFQKKQRYDYHMRGHTGERPFVCEFCDMKFRERKTLMVHRRTHTGEKPHRCGVCDKRFMHYNTFTAHVKTHGASYY